MQVNIGIDEAQRRQIAAGLEKLLADSYTLYLKTHGYHWNVTGPMFQTLHLMFMDQYTELWNALDLVAERIRALGYMAPASSGAYARLSSIGEDEDVPAANDMIANLVSGHETVIRTIREQLPAAAEAGDEVTADLLTQRLEVHEKTAWMLQSLLE